MTIAVEHIRALCFDVDGTLRDTDDQLIEQMTRMLQPVRFMFRSRNPEYFARRVIMSSEDFGRFIFELPDRLDVDHYLEKLGELFRNRLSRNKRMKYFVVNSVREMLKELYLYYPMAIISARNEHGTMDFLNQADLASYFKYFATSQTCRHTKPYPDPVLWAAQKMKVHASACLMIGDTAADIRAGKSAGAQTIGVLCGFGEKDELINAGADLVVNSTADILPYLLPNRKVSKV